MRKEIIVLVLAVFFFAFAIPVRADTIFNDASKWISGWSAECSKQVASTCKQIEDEGKAGKVAKAGYTKDVLDNKVPVCTMNTGKININKSCAAICPKKMPAKVAAEK